MDKVKILFLVADPSDLARLRLGQELRDVRNNLQRSKQRDGFLLESRESLRPGDITQAIFDVEPKIVHFSGHGKSTGELCFEDLQGKTQFIQPDALASLFELVSKQVSCVVLNACYSEAQAKAISEHIPYVLGMNKAIGDKAAIKFAVGFYKALGAGRSFEDAYKFGRVEIRLEGIPEHLTPVLYKKTFSKLISPENLEKRLDQPKLSFPKRTLTFLSLFCVSTGILFFTRVKYLFLNLETDTDPVSIYSPSQPGIYVSKLINPEYSEHRPTKTTVWLMAKGESTYTLDSIKIDHDSGICQSMGSGAVPPDADYRFTFTSSSRKLHSLNPALRLSPTDPREVSFTLGLAPEGSFSSSCGSITVRVHYHTSDGKQGSILLSDAPKDTKYLAQILDVNIKTFIQANSFFASRESQIVSPSGLQIGDDISVSNLEYIPLFFSHIYEMDSVLEEPPTIYNLKERELLNEYIVNNDKLSVVLDALSKGHESSLNICAGLISE